MLGYPRFWETTKSNWDKNKDAFQSNIHTVGAKKLIANIGVGNPLCSSCEGCVK